MLLTYNEKFIRPQLHCTPRNAFKNVMQRAKRLIYPFISGRAISFENSLRNLMATSAILFEGIFQNSYFALFKANEIFIDAISLRGFYGK